MRTKPGLRQNRSQKNRPQNLPNPPPSIHRRSRMHRTMALPSIRALPRPTSPQRRLLENHQPKSTSSGIGSGCLAPSPTLPPSLSSVVSSRKPGGVVSSTAGQDTRMGRPRLRFPANSRRSLCDRGRWSPSGSG
jgi:hypothetical protein